MYSNNELLDTVYKPGSAVIGISMGAISVYDIYNGNYGRAAIELLSSGFLLGNVYLINKITSEIDDIEEFEEELLHRDRELTTYRRAINKIESIVDSLKRRY